MKYLSQEFFFLNRLDSYLGGGPNAMKEFVQSFPSAQHKAT